MSFDFVIQKLVPCPTKILFFHFSAQMTMKARLAGAHKGHGLLKKKADALQMRFRLILGKIIEVLFPFTLFIYVILYALFIYSLGKKFNG